jgi:hypothetical protein
MLKVTIELNGTMDIGHWGEMAGNIDLSATEEVNQLLMWLVFDLIEILQQTPEGMQSVKFHF